MSNTVWISGVKSNSQIAVKTGLRTKYYGEDWELAKHDKGVPPDHIMDFMRKSGKGFCLKREEMPEAAAVFDEKCFQRTEDIFAIGGFDAVKGKLAENFLQLDFGEGGGLVPIPIYQADLITPYEGEYFLINYAARKNSFLAEQSRHVEEIGVDPRTGIRHWKIPFGYENGDTALSTTAVEGADLWHEETVRRQLFMKNAVVNAISEAGLTDEFKLKKCRIVEAQS